MYCCASAQLPDGKALADPPLLRLEGEACHAYLSMLMHLNTAASEPLQQAADVENRLLQLCIANLRCFQVRFHGAPCMAMHRMHSLSRLFLLLNGAWRMALQARLMQSSLSLIQDGLACRVPSRCRFIHPLLAYATGC